MQRALNALGYSVGRRKTRSLMREAEVRARYRKKYKVTTDNNHKQPVFENVLQRQFTAEGPDQAWVSDLTYIWTQEGWLYLTVFIELVNREVVGWSMSSRMKTKAVTDALHMALWRRRPAPGLIVHSDRGSQYASKAYRQLLKTRTEAQQDILDYIAMFYNSRRLHSVLDYRSPNDFGTAMAELKKAA